MKIINPCQATSRITKPAPEVSAVATSVLTELVSEAAIRAISLEDPTDVVERKMALYNEIISKLELGNAKAFSLGYITPTSVLTNLVSEATIQAISLKDPTDVIERKMALYNEIISRLERE